MAKHINIDGVLVGENLSPYVVAEMSANHNGDLDVALKTISEAKRCGANAVKIQTYTADTMTIDCDKDDFLIKSGIWKGQNLYNLYQEAHTPYNWHKPIFDHAKKEGITCFSTPFDESAVDLLEDLNCPAYKVASFEITDLTLIKYIALTMKPMIISTGMASKHEVNQAVSAIRACGNNNFILLHCISSYPASFSDMNLSAINSIKNDFNCSVGLSDHSIGDVAAIASIAMGACFIEKHFILDRKMGGPDSTFSIEPEEFNKLVVSTNNAWKCIGKGDYSVKDGEKENLNYRRSLYAVDSIKKGEKIDSKNVRRIRPGYGLPASEFENVLNRTVNKDVLRGDPICWDMLD